MKIKSTLTLSAATIIAMGSFSAIAEEKFDALSKIDVSPMTKAELSEVEGKAHDTFPLGALLLEKTNGRVAQTPAWEANHGLHPTRALSKAQVGKNAE